MEGVASQAQIYDAFSEKGREIYFRHQERFARRRRRRALDGRHRGRGQRRRTTPAPWSATSRPCAATPWATSRATSNVHSLLTTGGVYHGQRAIPGPRGDKRVMTLTRSAWAGQQRYGAFAWSGDTRAS